MHGIRMEKFTFAGITAVMFVIAKMVEARVSKRDAVPVRTMVRDATLVGASALAATYATDAVVSRAGMPRSPGAYVNAPEF